MADSVEPRLVQAVVLVWNDYTVGIFENPQDRGKIHAMLGQIGRFFGRVEFELHAPNVCRINSLVKTPPGGLPIGNASVPVGFARHVSRAEEDLSVPKKAPPFSRAWPSVGCEPDAQQ